MAASESSARAFRITVDTGGTFCDLVVADEQRVLGLFKAPTDREDVFASIQAALDLASDEIGISVGSLLGATGTFVYSTTHATNAILEGTTARTAFLCSEGHPNTLLYREGGKEQPHNVAMPYPEPYVPHHLTFELRERILADGSIAVKLDEGHLCGVLARLRELEVDAVGVCLLWSIVNPLHERRVGELLEAELGIPHTLSHELNPIVREYRRASSTVIDASLKPLLGDHLRNLESRLRDAGFQGDPLMVTHVSGGVRSLEDMCAEPLHTVDSGPALAPVAAQEYAISEERAWGEEVIVVDTGGTSFDIGLIKRGSILKTREKWLGGRWTGHITGLSAIDTQSVGAGGGSIAQVDSGGLLRVGPESAGANPGPAAYGQGGSRPTLTDAATVLGFIDPEFFLGGRIRLDVDAARKVVARDVGEPLGLSVPEAAEAIVSVASETMRGFIIERTVVQGIDPRDGILVAGGGAAGLNIVRIARDLGIETVLLPRLAAGLSAVGGQFADLMASLTRSTFLSSEERASQAARVVQELESDVESFLARLPAGHERRRRFVAEMRYEGEMWEIDVDLGESCELVLDDGLPRLHERFDAMHTDVFSTSQPDSPIEVLALRAEARGVADKPAMYEAPGDPRWEGEQGARTAYFDGTPVDVPVLKPGAVNGSIEVSGPLILEEPTTTIVLPPGSAALMTPAHYVVFPTSDASDDGRR